MKRRQAALLFCAGMLCTMVASGQVQKQSQIIPASSISTIVIECEGNCSISATNSTNIEIEASLNVTGNVYGISIGKDIPFELTTTRQGDTLHISTTSINHKGTVGISTYMENLDMSVSIPANITYVHAATKSDLNAELSKAGIGVVKCDARTELFLNGIEKESNIHDYEIDGTGMQMFFLKGNRIRLVTK